MTKHQSNTAPTYTPKHSAPVSSSDFPSVHAHACPAVPDEKRTTAARAQRGHISPAVFR